MTIFCFISSYQYIIYLHRYICAKTLPFVPPAPENAYSDLPHTALEATTTVLPGWRMTSIIFLPRLTVHDLPLSFIGFPSWKHSITCEHYLEQSPCKISMPMDTHSSRLTSTLQGILIFANFFQKVRPLLESGLERC